MGIAACVLSGLESPYVQGNPGFLHMHVLEPVSTRIQPYTSGSTMAPPGSQAANSRFASRGVRNIRLLSAGACAHVRASMSSGSTSLGAQRTRRATIDN
jgi:hypothetical protein